MYLDKSIIDSTIFKELKIESDAIIKKSR